MEKKKKRLTIAELRTFKGYENVTDEEAEFGIASLEKISIVFFELFQKKKKEMEKIRYLKDTRKENSEDGKERNAA